MTKHVFGITLIRCVRLTLIYCCLWKITINHHDSATPIDHTLKQAEEPNINKTLTNLNQNTFTELSQRSQDSISTHVRSNLDGETKNITLTTSVHVTEELGYEGQSVHRREKYLAK